MRPDDFAATTGRPGFPWALGAGYGGLWGMAVWSLETMSFALARWEANAPLGVLGLLALMWISRGIVLAWAGLWIAARLRAALPWLGVAMLTAALALAWDGVDAVSSLTQAALGIAPPSRSQWLYTLWVLLVYGTPFVAYCVLTERGRQTRHLLSQAAAARASRAAAFDQARLDMATRRIPPSLLARSLASIRQALDGPEEQVDRQLDRFVTYLRAAMPGLQSGQSSLGRELQLLRLYGEMAPASAPGLDLRVEAPTLDIDPPFPPGILLSIVEAAVAAAGEAGAQVRVGLTAGTSMATLSVDAGLPTGWLPDEVRRGAAAALARLQGPPWRLDHQGCGVRLTLPLDRPRSIEGVRPCTTTT